MTNQEAADILKIRMTAGLEGVDGPEIFEAYAKAIKALNNIDKIKAICDDLFNQNQELFDRLVNINVRK